MFDIYEPETPELRVANAERLPLLDRAEGRNALTASMPDAISQEAK